MMIIDGRRVTFGIHYNFRNPPHWGRPWADVYRETFEHIELAEQLGYDDVWTTEHHFIDDGYSPSILPLCAAIAARTHRVGIGTRVLLGPLYDPLRLAEDTATVDVISDGRLILGIGLGYRMEEYAAMGVSPRQRGAVLEELVHLLRAAWAAGPLDFAGQFHEYHGVEVTPKPVQQPIPIWIGGGVEAAGRRAGRLGDGLLAEGTIAAAYVEQLERTRPGAVSRASAGVPWALVDEDPERAWAEIGEHVLYQRRAANGWLSANGRPEFFPNLPETPTEYLALNPDVVVTPQRARQLVTDAVARSSTDEVNIAWYGIPPGVPPTRTHHSIELFAAEMLAGEETSDQDASERRTK
jgi:probable F420-dependent oxidoreductase